MLTLEKSNSDILLMNNYSVTERQKVNADRTLFNELTLKQLYSFK